MNHLEGSTEVEVTDEAPGGEVNESVEADLEHPDVEEEQRSPQAAGRHPRGRAVEEPRAQLAQQEEEERGESLARSASTESGFHNHTDTAEGDVIAAAREGYDTERTQDPEDESAYAVQYRPEAEEYTEQAEAEHAEAAHRRALPNHLHFHSLEHEEAMNAAYSGYVYTHRLFHRGEDEPYAEPYADYGGLQEHVYEEIGDAPELDVRDGLRLYVQERDEAAAYRQEALGARLHHYDERSDGESDSPEKEAEFAPYPRMDSYEQEEDIDQIVAEVKQSMSSQSLDKAAEDMPEAEQDLERAPTPGGGRPDSPGPPAPAGQQKATGPAGGETGQRYSKEKRDAISLAIKDIKEAIEEVKTRTIRSPYTPDEPKEPIWVMRQDISPTRDCDDQRPVDGDSPSPGSSSPLGAESSSIPLHPSDPTEASTNKESRKSLASFPTYVEVPGPCDPEDLIDGIIFAANYLGSTQLLSDKTPSKNVRMMQAQEAVSRIKQMAQKLAKSRKKAPEGESQPMTEVDLFISTQRIKVLNADTQEPMMDHPLRTISYIADIGNIVVLMARRRMPRSNSQENVEASHPSQDGKRQYKMICHVFESEDGLKNQSRIKLNIVRCPPVTTVLIRRPDLRYQLGFSVQNGIICSLMRGGIAERGGVRVGHRIIEINGQSVVATPHEKIVHILSNAVGEIHMKTMPAAMYRLLTAQEQPVYI
ncbi:amyloid-beta A4 precursor protein-binding family A member 1 isoform X5 [Nannospalax galili]|uniref:amyloid-beta A4 precursor protein-binding family A member 1 isoform X5 n=1 Tax=Nannospalax galili TaxID=1026970 RepID=UPI0004ED3300|nr:amyloid-beta A4 precursor protein-binding family A member 1 isoform X5 [Nannospalax galili]